MTILGVAFQLAVAVLAQDTPASCSGLSCGEGPPRATRSWQKTRRGRLPIEDFKIVEPETRDASPEAPSVRAKGTHELSDISARYRPAIEEGDQSAGVLRPTLETARDNIESVVQISFARYQEHVEAGSDSDKAGRVGQLKFVSVDKWTTREVKPDSGIFAARAVFSDEASHQQLDAEVIGDFSVPHWHLSEIKLNGPVKGSSPPSKKRRGRRNRAR